jgi:hypothetical protein
MSRSLILFLLVVVMLWGGVACAIAPWRISQRL